MAESGPEQEPTNESEDAEGAVDTLAFLLRALGQYGFDTVNTTAAHAREDLEAWARHVLVGSAPPHVAAASLEEGARDWKGLCRFASEKRRDEAAYVIKSSSDLRGALWTFIQGMASAVPRDRDANTAITGQLEKLRTCLDSGDTGELRRIAASSIEVIDQEIADRIERDDRQIERLATQVQQVSDELVDAREKLERDALTGVFNRGAFDEFISKMAHLGMLSAQPSTLMIIDVDDFKWVNDRCGHPAGDAVLQEVASSLLAGFGRRGDFVARYGGDEFAVIIQTQNESIDEELAEAALHRVRDLSIPNGDDEIRVSLSIGSSRLHCGETSDEWLARSDRALYRAKEAGRDRLVIESDQRQDES